MSDTTPAHARIWIPKLARLAAEAAEQDRLADTLFELSMAIGQAESRMWNEVITTLGCDPEDVDSWPAFEDITWDSYDSSFELKGAGLEVIFTEEQWNRFASLGFKCAWICYVDGTQRCYPGGFRNQQPGIGIKSA